jgi:hypothetical protein
MLTFAKFSQDVEGRKCSDNVAENELIWKGCRLVKLAF